MPARRTVVSLGEILWDVFPDGPKFGGAPANFACAAAELGGAGQDVFIVGSVGGDTLGQDAIGLLKSHGVDTNYVSLAGQPTGQVLVELDDAGRPTFEIATDTAWDNIRWSDDYAQLATRADVVCFGTLAQRSAVSREAIRRFLHATRADCLRILDINLRPPFWDEAVVRESLELANVLKLNDSELMILADLMHVAGSEEQLLQSLFEMYDLHLIALTRGPGGATLINKHGERSDLPGETVEIVDTVGAGDAFTAALAIGILHGDSLATINARANRVAAFVCSHAGATPIFPSNL